MLLSRKQTGKLVLYLVLYFVAFKGFGQSKGFILQGDSVYSEGFIHYSARKPWQVGFSYIRSGTPRDYTAEELTGFGFQDSTVYATKIIPLDGNPQRLFLEVIGDSAFFFLQRDNAFFKKAVPLEQVSEGDLLPYLRSLTDPAAKWYKDLHLFRLNRNSLRYFANNNATERRSPTVMFGSSGFFSGFNRSSLSSQRISKGTAHRVSLKAASSNISAGAFADIPAWSLRNTSLYAQASYGKMRFNETILAPNTRYDVKADFDFGRLSLMPSYTHSFSKIRTFLHAGPSMLYFFKSDSKMLEAITETDKVFISHASGLDVSSRVMFGFEAGAGIRYFYLPQHYLSLGLSQASTYGKYFIISNQSFTVSLNL